MPMIDDILIGAALRAPNRIAIREWESGREISYRALDDAVTAFANWMHGQGFKPGELVGIHLPNSIAFLLTQFAAFRAGGVAAYINHRLTPIEAARQLKLGRARIIVTTSDKATAFRDDADFKSVTFVLSDGGLPLGYRLDDAISGRSDTHPQVGDRVNMDALLRFTSGSTGAPKGVLVSHRAWMMRAISHIAEDLPITPFSTTLIVGPLPHHGGLLVNPTLFRNGKVLVMDGFSADKMGAALLSEPISCTQMVPTIMHRMLENAGAREALRTSGVGRIHYGGSPIRREVIDDALELLPATEFTQVYGSHEAGMISYLDNGGHRDPELRYSAGHSFLVSDIRIVPDRAGDQIGEIQVRSPWAPHARITEEGREALSAEWVGTGDLGEMRDGYIFLRDRKNDVIISGGFNIYPLEVEAVLNGHPQVLNAVVASVPDDSWGEKVVAFVVPRNPANFNSEGIRDYCRASLADYKVPKEVNLISDLPLNVNGKPDRRKLTESFWADRGRRIN